MNIEIKNLNNLTNDEKETLIRLAEKANKKSKVFVLKKNQNYYFITTDGKIDRKIWEDVEWDNDLFNLGNCFETKEQAEFALEKQKVYTQLKRYAFEHNEGAIDWDDTKQEKWYINLDIKYKSLVITYNLTWKSINDVHFTSKEIAQNAIKEIGEDRIKKYLFEVGE